MTRLGELWRELARLNTRALGDHLTAAAIGQTGLAGVMALAQAYRGYVKEFPGLYQASLRVSGNLSQPDPDLLAAEAWVVRVALALVESFGLTGAEAIHSVRALRARSTALPPWKWRGDSGSPWTWTRVSAA